MRLSISTNFQDDYIDEIKKFSVKEVYGKLNTDFVGGGRPSFMLPVIGKKKLGLFIKELHLNGIKFNYLLNSTCLNNREVTKKGYNKIRSDLDWLSEIGTDSVTVAISFLGQIIKKHYPQFNLHVSAFAGVRSLRHAQYWEELGADVITLEPQTLNREFSIIKNISSNIKAELQVIANQGCLYCCPNVNYHANLVSHASQSKHRSKGFLIDYCAFECKTSRLNEKVNFIRADWIRPEDMKEYEKVGVKNFKLIQRNWTTMELVRVIKAYSEREYKGNLADLVEFLFRENTFLTLSRKIKYFLHPFKGDLYGAWKKYRRIKQKVGSVEIDNKSLDGFLDIFKKESCQMKNCNICRYCHTVADKVVKIDTKQRI